MEVAPVFLKDAAGVEGLPNLEYLAHSRGLANSARSGAHVGDLASEMGATRLAGGEDGSASPFTGAA